MGALTIALEPLRVPLFFWPGQYLHFWEIPIIAAFFLFGFKVAISVSIIDAVGYLALFPDGAGIVGPPWRLIVMSTMFLGLFIAQKITNLNNRGKKSMLTSSKKTPLVYALLPTVTRTAIMPFVDIAIYRHVLPLVVGPIPDVFIMGLIPAFIFFNIVVPLYSVPIGFYAAKIVRKNFPNHYFTQAP